MEKLVLSERELSAHWGVNVKTLQRWRAEGRGPRLAHELPGMKSLICWP